MYYTIPETLNWEQIKAGTCSAGRTQSLTMAEYGGHSQQLLHLQHPSCHKCRLPAIPSMPSRKTLNEISPRAQTPSWAKQPCQLTAGNLVTPACPTSSRGEQLACRSVPHHIKRLQLIHEWYYIHKCHTPLWDKLIQQENVHCLHSCQFPSGHQLLS